MFGFEIYMRDVALKRLGSVLLELTCCMWLDTLFLQIKVSHLYLFRTCCYSTIFVCAVDTHGEQQHLHIYMSS